MNVLEAVATAAAHLGLNPESYQIENMGRPHRQPANLPAGKAAVYIFVAPWRVLKVGKVGRQSGPRYTSQHYNPGSARSGLAKSILTDPLWQGPRLDQYSVGNWIKANCQRVNFLHAEEWVTGAMEILLHDRLNPLYERGRRA